MDFEIRWIDQDPEVGLSDSPYEFAEYTSDANWAGTAEAPVYYPLAFEDEIEVSVEGPHPRASTPVRSSPSSTTTTYS